MTDPIPYSATHQTASTLGPSMYQYSTSGHSVRGFTLGLLAGLITLGVTGCNSSFPSGTPSTIPPASVTTTGERDPIPFRALQPPTRLLQTAQLTVPDLLTHAIPPEDAVTVTVYTLDTQCQGFEPHPVQVSKVSPLEDAINTILTTQNLMDFELSGYRLSVVEGTATIDLRLASNSKRLLVSLSNCEQQALLGSLRQTLLANPDWGIQAVTFTNRGNPLVL